jgi:hypothetical protein
MADQKNDDSKTPFARRGARPFGGSPGSSAPSRPFIRPATSQRPTAAPFVAPVGPGKLVLRNAAPAPAAKTPTPVAPPSISSADIDATPLSASPVAKEIVALDAIDTFDAVWGVSEPPVGPIESAAVASPLDELSLGEGIDGQQLWGEHITANDITAKDIPAGEPESVAVPVAFESSDTAAASTTPAWLEDDVAPAPDASPSLVVAESQPAVPDVPTAPTPVSPLTDAEGHYGFGEWTDAHTIPASDEIMGVLPEQRVEPALEPLGGAPASPADCTGDEAHDAPVPQVRFELVEAPPEKVQAEAHREEPQVAIVTAAPTAPAFAPHEARIAATFDRLADRVRSGEIDVSSIAPDATDGAVVASVLAALLGGSRSR